MKTQHSISLVGVLSDNTVAKTHQADQVELFLGLHPVTNKIYFVVDPTGTISTPKGSYNLSKYPTLNIFTGVCNGTKVHVSLKKVVGELRTWF